MTKFDDNWVKNVTSSDVLKSFSIFGQCELAFDPRWPIFKLNLEIIKITFLTNFQDIWIKTADKLFLLFSFYDLVFDRRWLTSSNLTCISLKFDDDAIKTVTSRVLTTQLLTTHARHSPITIIPHHGHFVVRWAKKLYKKIFTVPGKTKNLLIFYACNSKLFLARLFLKKNVEVLL
jgi:hypothetical protein